MFSSISSESSDISLGPIIWRAIPITIALTGLALGISGYLLGLDNGYFLAWSLYLGSTWVLIEIVRDLLSGKWGADLLAVVSILVSLYLDEYIAGLVIVLMVSGGEVLEELATLRACSVLAALSKRMPHEALKRATDKTMEKVNINSLNPGDEVVIPPHAICPTDGTVIEGYGVMDEAYLTGEPTHIPKAPGASVLSGAVNGEHSLVIQVTTRAQDSRYAKIVSVIETTTQMKVPLRRLGDRLGAVFTPLALGVALLCWWISGDTTRFLAVLVVATPCPLILSIPVAIIGAVSVAARQGILIRQAGILEELPKCRTLILDKTGTLTMGYPQVADIIIFSDLSEYALLSLVASLEQYSRHPLGQALLREAEQRNLPLHPVTSVSEKPGCGLVGVVGQTRVTVSGRKAVVRSQEQIQQHHLIDSTEGLECFIWIDDELSAQIKFRDLPRPESASFVAHLDRQHGFSKVMIVSGDRQSEVQYLAQALGIDHVHAEISPEGKLDIVEAELKQRSVVFIGDGINDAPALVAATVGITIGESSEVTSNAADAVILNSSLRSVDRLFHLSLRTRRIILQSVGFGMLASVCAMIIASYGYITPTMGALIQEVIDLVSLGNALRISFVKTEESDF